MIRWIFATLIFLHLGCGPHEAGPLESEPQPISSTPQRNSKIPIEVSYPIISDTEEYNHFTKKRFVDVRLNMKVSAEVLREIALEVKATEIKQYERTFINYHLYRSYAPLTKGRAWAITPFNPTLSVQILGLTMEQEEKLRNLPLDEYSGRIGAWLVDSQHSVCVLYPTSSGMRLDALVGKDAKFTSDMVELPSQEGRRFRKVSGGYIYAVSDSGVLGLYDEQEGHLVEVGEPLE